MKEISIENINTWKTENSIFNFLKNLLNNKGEIEDPFVQLPNMENDENEIGLVPGFFDTLTPPDESPEAQLLARRLTDVLERIAVNSPDSEGFQEIFYEAIVDIDKPVSGYIDILLDEIIERDLLENQYITSFAKALAFQTNNDKTVKIGISLLGISDDKSVIEDLRVLGAYDEFTSYVAIALEDLLDDPTYELWDLAKKAKGWGKIQTVEQLVEDDLPEEIKEWLILDGYKNYIMDEYLALLCAEFGELHLRLEKDVISERMYQSSMEIIEALLSEDAPNGNIFDYKHSSTTIQHFLHHSKTHAKELPSYYVIDLIKGYLTDLLDSDDDLFENGWQRDEATNCIIESYEILKDKKWNEIILVDLQSQDNITFWYARTVAENLGMDIWNVIWKRLQKEPNNPSNWDDVRFHVSSKEIDDVIELASKEISWEENEIPNTKNYFDSVSKEIILIILEQYPNKGEDIILKTLNSNHTRLRNATLITLERWGLSNWNPAIYNQIDELKNRQDLDSRTKENIDKLLKGEKMDWVIYLDQEEDDE